MKYHFKIHKEKAGGYWARSLEKGLNVTTQGETLRELRRNMKEALHQALEESWIDPDPSFKGKKNVEEVSVRITPPSNRKN